MTNRTPVPAEFGGTTQADHGGATARQLEYIGDLLRKREITGERLAKFGQRYGALAAAGELTTLKASEIIKFLKTLPARTTPLEGEAQAAPAATTQDQPYVEYEERADDKGDVKQVGTIVMPEGRVPMGSYGVDTTGDDRFTNDTTFFRVWINKEYGKGWGAQMYVSDDRVKIRVPLQMEMIRKIAQDPAAASALFGHEYKRCGICGRGLTNDESRERGIGPVCAQRF